jgi:phage tail tape-measure protein
MVLVRAFKSKLGRDVIAALVKEIGASAKGAAAQNLGTFSGLITQIKDRWEQFLQSIADAGVLDYAKNALSELLKCNSCRPRNAGGVVRNYCA